MNNFQLIEATLKQKLPTNKIIDPALLTMKEYYSFVNPNGKSHPSTAYDADIEDLNKYESDIKDYPKLINNLTIKGLKFEVRAKVINTYTDNKYVKYDKEGEQVRINGELQYFTPEELETLGKKKWEYNFVIFEKEINKIVGRVQDEWGCVLIMVAREYRGFGLGNVLYNLVLEYQPEKTSGGFTQSGYDACQRAYSNYIREKVKSGYYNQLLKSKQISLQRVKEIIDSAKLSNYNPKSKISFSDKTNFGIDRKQWVLFSENGEFILYDKRLKDHYKEEDDYWSDKFFIGMIYASTSEFDSKYNRVHSFGGINDYVKQYLLMCQLTECRKHKEELLLNQEQLDLLDKKAIKVKPFERDNKLFVVTLKRTYKMQYLRKIEKEQAFRLSFDKYDEFKYYMMEGAYAKFD